MKKSRKDIESKTDSGEKRLPAEASMDGNPAWKMIEVNDSAQNTSRRDFLKLCGYSVAVGALSSCKSRITKAIPYVIAPDEMTPGQALWYASTYVNGNDYCSILVKTRDGRPIKIEGNPASAITAGGTSARVQASVLDLYDGERHKGPFLNGTPVDWVQADEEIRKGLGKIAEGKGSIMLLTPSVFSPSTEAVIQEFLRKFPGSGWVKYDAISCSAMLEANEKSFGRKVIPDYRFDLADLIVSCEADFLGTWLSPVEFTKQFSSRRDPEKSMNYLIQIESGLTLAGSNADKRIQIKPSQEYAVLLNIYSGIVKTLEGRETAAPSCPVDVGEISRMLASSRGKSIVISGSNVKETQLLVNEINRYLGNIGSTILFESFLRTRQGIDSDMELLVQKMNSGNVDALIIWNTNPAFTWHNREAFKEGLKKVGLTVSLSGSPDETGELVKYVCPDNHYLESWNDAEPRKDFFSLMQPVIQPIFNTRQMTDSLLKWADSQVDYYNFVKSLWVERMKPRQTEFTDSVAFFDNMVQRGIFEPVKRDRNIKVQKELNRSTSFSPFNHDDEAPAETSLAEIILYEPVAQGEGRQANNPWLQELPDPVTRICWDNYASISVVQARENGLTDGDLIEVAGFSVPVHLQPGQAYGTISIALGYGRSRCGMVGEGVGIDSWSLVSYRNGNVFFNGRLEKLVKKGSGYQFAQVQTHHSMEGRPLLREASLKDFKSNPSAGNEMHEYFYSKARSLYKEWEYPYHHWGMAIDLNRCIGCANCVLACQSENNFPTVGKMEVHRVHEMHWIRIDRYYTGDDSDPQIAFQPVLCQHCQNAPCENVCPVAATNHSIEGLNQMIYNRCFGTRYCNNNCPYKVRRFNWFNYTGAGTLSGNLRDKAGMTGDMRRMVLNPDVTIRGQGVIEKCSFCVQRIQAAKLKAKAENRTLYPNEVQTACAQSCPANAIIFGDLNDKESELSRMIRSKRTYNLLEDLFTKPSVNYLTKIRNKIL